MQTRQSGREAGEGNSGKGVNAEQEGVAGSEMTGELVDGMKKQSRELNEY